MAPDPRILALMGPIEAAVDSSPARSRSLRRKLGLILHVPIYVVAFALFVLLTYLSAPALEERIDPVVADQRITDVSREGDVVCFTWHMRKRRQAKTVFLAWSMFDHEGDKASVSPFYREGGAAMDIAKSRAPRAEPYAVPLCVRVPPDIDEPFEILGRLEYEVAGRPWRISHDIPPVKVPRG